jgi:hypothetical protein
MAAPGDRLTLPIEVTEAGTYELVGFFTRARNYGIVRVHANGKALRPMVDGYSEAVEPSGPISFGTISLEAGTNEIILIGKDARSSGYSSGYLVGIDGFLLR